MTIETRTFAVISTAHVCSETAEWLNHQGEIVAAYHRTHEAPAHQVCPTIYGWLIYADPEAEKGFIPDDLLNVIKHVRQAGFHYVSLDCDAEAIDGLPTYEW